MLNKNVNRFRLFVSAVVLTSLIVVFSACTSAPASGQISSSGPSSTGQTTTSSSTGTSASPNTTQPPIASSGFDFILGVSKVLPSVATIEVTYGPNGAPGQPFATGAAGSGWVIDSNGILVTNDHVVTGAQTITVTLSDGRRFAPSAVQSSPQDDLAVVKIGAQNLPVASIGNSSSLQLGQLVAAVGNSLNMGIRVTGGLVSRLGTTATYSVTGGQGNSITLNNLIETDATINPGNSGGVLINTSGQVVGIVNAGLEGPNTDIEGFGYAISIDGAMPILNGLISKLP